MPPTSTRKDCPYALRSLKPATQTTSNSQQSRYTLRSSLTNRASISQSLQPKRSIKKMYTFTTPRRSPRKNPAPTPAPDPIRNERWSRKLVWPPQNEEKLVHLLIDKVHKGITPPFASHLRDIQFELNNFVGAPVYSFTQVQNKVKCLKARYVDFKTLLGNTICTGFGWDPITNTVSGPEHEWEKLKADYGPDRYFRFKNHPPIHYELLACIFDGSYATGALGLASTQDVPESDTEEPVIDLNSPPAAANLNEHDTDHINKSKGKGKRCTSSKDSGRSSKRSSQRDEFLDKLEEGWTKSLSRFDSVVDKYSNSNSSHAASSRPHPVKSSVEQAFDIINDLSVELKISDDKYYRDLDYVTHSNRALMVLKMDDARRRRWLSSVI